MAEDIVKMLRDDERNNPSTMQALLSGYAADEIERLRTERDEWQAEYHKAFSELGLAADEIERLRAIGRSHYGPHHDPMWCPICDKAWPCPTWSQFFGEEARRG